MSRTEGCVGGTHVLCVCDEKSIGNVFGEKTKTSIIPSFSIYSTIYYYYYYYYLLTTTTTTTTTNIFVTKVLPIWVLLYKSFCFCYQSVTNFGGVLY